MASDGASEQNGQAASTVPDSTMALVSASSDKPEQHANPSIDTVPMPASQDAASPKVASTTPAPTESIEIELGLVKTDSTPAQTDSASIETQPPSQVGPCRAAVTFCLVALAPVVCSEVVMALPYSRFPGLYFLSSFLATFNGLPMHSTLAGLFFPALRAQPGLGYLASAVLACTLTLLWMATFLPHWQVYPLNFMVVCTIYGTVVTFPMFLVNLFAQWRVNQLPKPFTMAHFIENVKRTLFFSLYWIIGGSPVGVHIGYLVVFALTRTSAEQLFANLALHVLILGEKQIILVLNTSRLADFDARWIFPHYMEVMTDALALIVYSAMSLNAFIVITVFQFLSMLSYLPMLTSHGTTIKNWVQKLLPTKLQSRQKTFKERIENASVNLFMAMYTQVIACAWYLTASWGMRYLPWLNDSFPLTVIPWFDFKQGEIFVAIALGTHIVFFLVCRAIAIYWLGPIADPMPYATRVFCKFPSAFASAACLGLVSVTAIMLKPAQILFYIYSDPGSVLLVPH